MKPFITSFVPKTILLSLLKFVECLLCARHSGRPWVQSGEQEGKMAALTQFVVYEIEFYRLGSERENFNSRQLDFRHRTYFNITIREL